MKRLLTVVWVVFLAAIGAGGVLYADKVCKDKQMTNEDIHVAIEQYVNNHSKEILEKLAKSESFGNIIRSFSTISDNEIENMIKQNVAQNPALFEEYIRNNASYITAIVLDTDEFKEAIKNNVSTDSSNEEQNNENNNAEENQKYLDHWEEMRNSSVAPFIGPQDASVAVVEFFDFACGHCKALAPIMAQLIKNNPDVKFVFQPLYFISDHSNYAAKTAMAAAKKGKFLEVYEGIMSLPEMTEETINQILADEGLDVAEIKNMIEEKEIRRGSQDIDSLSQVLGINGVPMLFVNGEPFYGRSLEDMQNKLNQYK